MRLRFKWAGTWDDRARLLRLCRFTWETATNGHQLTLALSPVLFRVIREYGQTAWTFCGVRIHKKLACKGTLVP